MTPRAKALRSAVAAAVGPGRVDAALRAVVEELGVRKDSAHAIRVSADALKSAAGRKETALAIRQRELAHEANETADALATLFEACGADR